MDKDPKSTATTEKTNQVEPTVQKDNFDDLLKSVGDAGKFQWFILFICSLNGIFTSFHSLAAVFLVATPNFQCQTSPISIEDSLNWLNNGSEFSREQKCGPSPDVNRRELILSGMENITAGEEIYGCDSWVYDESVYGNTIVSEWDLVCGREWLRSAVQAGFMGGSLFGSLVFNKLPDIYGRRPVTLMVSVCYVVTGILSTFSQNIWMFLILRFLVAIFDAQLVSTNFVIVMEVIRPRLRSTMGVLMQLPLAIGYCLLSLLAYYIHDWRNIQLVISASSSVLLVYFVALPESPRWLLSKGRHSEAMSTLRNIAKFNGKSIPEQQNLEKVCMKTRVKENEKKSKTLHEKAKVVLQNQLTPVRTPNMRRRCLTIFFCWFVIAMVYYGLPFNGSNINASIYMLVFLSGAVEFPAQALTIIFLKKFGRRINFMVGLLGCGFACLLILAVPKEMVWLNMILSSIGKLFIAVAFSIAYIYTTELVPTRVRNTSMGIASVCARMGGILAPFIVDFLGNIHRTIPSTIFGSLSIVAACLVFLLPETGNTTLPDTVEEVEAMDK